MCFLVACKAKAPAAPENPPASAKEAPIRASFVALPYTSKSDECTRAYVIVTEGDATVAGKHAVKGEALRANCLGTMTIEGSGEIVLATAPRSSSDCSTREACDVVVLPQSQPLSWAKGKMHATGWHAAGTTRIDGAQPGQHAEILNSSAELYVGSLSGEAPVSEHVHEGSWEVLCPIDIAGTMRSNDEDSRPRAKHCVYVPPNTKHSWNPDPGGGLSAIQFYVPGGPEERFQALAKADAAEQQAEHAAPATGEAASAPTAPTGSTASASASAKPSLPKKVPTKLPPKKPKGH